MLITKTQSLYNDLKIRKKLLPLNSNQIYKKILLQQLQQDYNNA